MIADYDMQEAARLVTRACGLLEPHTSIWALRQVRQSLTSDASMIRTVARNTREGDKYKQEAIFA